MTCFLFFCNSSASQDKEPEGYACVSGGTLSLRFKRSGTKLGNTSLSTGVFKGPPDTQAYPSGSLSYEV